MPAAAPLYKRLVMPLARFVETKSKETFRVHSAVHQEGWGDDAPSELWTRVWDNQAQLVMVMRHEERGTQGEIVAHASNVGCGYAGTSESGLGLAFGVRTCRLLLMSAACLSARNPRRGLLESQRVAFDALEGTFHPSSAGGASASTGVPITWVPDISGLMHKLDYGLRPEVPAAEAESIRIAALAKDVPLDDASLKTIHDNLSDLHALLREREVCVVTMRPGATVDELHQALIEMGLVRPPAPVPIPEPPRQRRKRPASRS